MGIYCDEWMVSDVAIRGSSNCAGCTGIAVYLLFGVSTSARPLSDNVLARLIVGRKSERDTRESRSEIDSDNQLGLTPTGTFDLDGGVAHILLSHPGGGHAVRGHGLLHVARGRAHRGHGGLVLVLHVGVQGRRVVGELLGGG